jgi:hypothetical protein
MEERTGKDTENCVIEKITVIEHIKFFTDLSICFVVLLFTLHANETKIK